MNDLRLLASIVVTASIAACGGARSAAPDAKSPAGRAESEPETIEEAQAHIARARAELGMAPRPADHPDGRGPEQPNGGTAPAPPAPPPRPPPADAAKAEPATSPITPTSKPAARPPADASSLDDGRASVREDRCASPCRAIASMRRAVNALCRMTTDEDPRCVEARKTLAESEQRISGCSC